MSTVSIAGFNPIRASPAPRDRPQYIRKLMPRTSSVGWLGCRREESVPGRPRSVARLGRFRKFFGHVDQFVHVAQLRQRRRYDTRQSLAKALDVTAIGAGGDPLIHRVSS